MLIKQAVLEGIVAGKVTLAFRRWKRPTVKAGGTLRTRLGVLQIQAVDTIDWADVTDRDAKAAGYDSRAGLEQDVARREGQLYRVKLKPGGEDPRIALRQQNKLSKEETRELRARLERLDQASPVGPWTLTFLKMIADRPAERAPDLAASIGWEKPPFKRNVRKLKELGLTESLKVGYRLSPRGKALLKKL